MKEHERLHRIDSDSFWVIVSERQSQGFGRGANHWHSSIGGLWFTFDMTYPRIVESYALYIGACLHKVLCQRYPMLVDKLRIKWPNDIYYEDKKVAGILNRFLSAESRYVSGIGINTNNHIESDQIVTKAISLRQILDVSISNNDLLRSLISYADTNRNELYDPKVYIDYCNFNLYGMNRNAIIDFGDSEYEGTIVGIDDNGSLLMKDNHGYVKSNPFGSLRILNVESNR